MDRAQASRRFEDARVARLATVRPDGGPHLVPVVFALLGETVYAMVDDKPKSSRRLQRLANVRAEPRVSLLVDHYEEDWDALWWVRADGLATVHEEGSELRLASRLLVEEYQQYRGRPPNGPALVIQISSWRWWPGG